VLFCCRLDSDVGTGVHLTPTGVEFDERRLTLGKSTEVRACEFQREDGTACIALSDCGFRMPQTLL
jgi:hypothetical protein